MKVLSVVLLMIVLMVFGALSQGVCPLVCPEFETHFADGFSLSFSLRGLFLDTEAWNAMIPEGSGFPELDGIVCLHGATVAVPLENGLHFGMSAYGAKLNETNELGYTTWNGAMAGLSLESIWASSTEGAYGHVGGGLYCGTFNFSSSGVDGTGITGYGGAFYLEPYIGVSYQVSDCLFVQGKISTIVSLLPGNAWAGGRESGPDICPNGPMLTLTVGWRGLNW